MHFLPTEEHEMIRDSAREYAERYLKPNAARWDREEVFPEEAIQAAAEAGFLGLVAPEDLGGAGLGNLHAAIMLEEINRWDASTGVTVSVHLSLVCGPILKYGTEDQKKRYLPRLASGEILGAYALTEPHSGSDAAAMRTRAERVDGGWKLNGVKSWITTATHAGVFIVYAITDPEGRKGRNVGAFLVDRDTEGLEVGKKEPKLGIRASSTCEMNLRDAFVPGENLLGEADQGFKVALDTLDGGRIGIASQALGVHRACLEDSVRYAKERQQFGRPIGEFQGIAWKLADMATELDAARMLVHRAAWLRDQGLPCSREASMGKLFASRVCNKAAQEAVQIHGGAGYTSEFDVERYFRDARITEIYEGATDIQRLVISRQLLR